MLSLSLSISLSNDWTTSSSAGKGPLASNSSESVVYLMKQYHDDFDGRSGSVSSPQQVSLMTIYL